MKRKENLTYLEAIRWLIKGYPITHKGWEDDDIITTDLPFYEWLLEDGDLTSSDWIALVDDEEPE